MRPARLAAGIGFVAAGVFLLLAPIASPPPMHYEMGSGQWVPVDVSPWSSITGSPAVVTLAWERHATCWQLCPGQPFTAWSWSFEVFDCGTTACRTGATYPAVGDTAGAPLGSVDFSAPPGHHYEVWAWAAPSYGPGVVDLWVTTSTPVLCGFLGAAFIGIGAVLVVTAVRRTAFFSRWRVRSGTAEDDRSP